ncbi:MAG: NusG domain II-containing protein [Pseudobutyrivibrio sp.]|nr:NusG domain II-containing protein [Pseudobutyrivibrio sp.]
MRISKYKNDIILIIALIVIGSIIATYFYFTRNGGSEVVVAVGGQTVATYPLNEDTVETIELDDGHYNEITIKDSTVSVTDADCPDKLCIHWGTISKDGEAIVCLPHELVVMIKSTEAEKESEFDGVAQ